MTGEFNFFFHINIRQDLTLLECAKQRLLCDRTVVPKLQILTNLIAIKGLQVEITI